MGDSDPHHSVSGSQDTPVLQADADLESILRVGGFCSGAVS